MKMKEEALRDKIPILDEMTARFLYTQVKIKKPKRILEIGFGGGYSTLWMALGNPQAEITSLEKNKERFEKGQEKLKNLPYNINLLFEDARIFLKDLDGMFDFVFIDAVKSQYLNYFQSIETKLNPGSVVFADNIFYRGKLFEEEMSPKKRKEVVKLKEFIKRLNENKKFETLFLPIGDGLSMSLYRGDEF